MSNSIFCPNCGMLKSNCTCGHSNNEVSSSNGDSVDLFSFQKPRSSSILDDEIPEVYSIEDHRLDEDTVSYLQGKYWMRPMNRQNSCQTHVKVSVSYLSERNEYYFEPKP